MRTLPQILLRPDGNFKSSKTYVGFPSRYVNDDKMQQLLAEFFMSYAMSDRPHYMVVKTAPGTKTGNYTVGHSGDLNQCIAETLIDTTSNFIVHFGPKLIQYDPI